MAEATPNQPEAQQADPVVEAAEQDLQEIKQEEGDTKAELQGKIRRLNTTLEDLQGKYEEANFDHNDKDAVRFLDEIEKVQARMQELEEAKKTASDDADSKREKVADRLDAKAKKGAKREETKGELETALADATAIIDSTDPKTVEQKKEAHKDREKTQGQLDRLEAKEGRDHAMEEAARYKAEEAKLRAEENPDAKLALDLAAGEVTPAVPAETPEAEEAEGADKSTGDKHANAPSLSNEQQKSFESRVDGFKLGIAQQIANNPPKTGWEKMTTQVKYFMLTTSMMLTGDENNSWCEKLTEPEKQMLVKVVGMKITDNGETTDTPPQKRFKIEQVPPDKEFTAPDNTTQDVFTHYFDAMTWMEPYERVCKLSNGTPTIKEVAASIAGSSNPDDVKLQTLLTDLMDPNKVGAKDTDPFFEAISKRGYLLGIKDSAKEAESPEVSEATLNAADTDKLVGVIEEEGFTAETSMRDLSLAYIADETGQALDPALIQTPEGRSAYAKAVMEKAPQTVADVIRVNGMIPTLEDDALLAKDPKDWTPEDKTALEGALVGALETAIGPKGDRKLGAAVAAMEKHAGAEGKAAAAKLSAALAANAPELTETAVAKPEPVAEKVDGGLEHIQGSNKFYDVAMDYVKNATDLDPLSPIGDFTQKLLPKLFSKPGGDAQTQALEMILVQSTDSAERTALAALVDASDLSLADKVDWQAYSDGEAKPTPEMVARLMALPAAQTLLNTPANIQVVMATLKDPQKAQSFGVSESFATAVQKGTSIAEYLDAEIAAKRDVEGNQALAAAIEKNNVRDLPSGGIDDYDADVLKNLQRYGVQREDGTFWYVPHDKNGFVDLSQKLDPDSLFHALVPGIIKDGSLDTAGLAALNSDDGYRQFTFYTNDGSIKYDSAQKQWVNSEDGAVYQLPSQDAAAPGFHNISIGELVTPSSPATT